MAASRRGYLLLDAVTGWQAALTGVVEFGSERALSLEPLPGTALPLFDSDVPVNSPVCPSGVVSEGCGRLIVADAATHEIYRLDVSRGTSRPITAIGGLGSSPRRFREPRGVALSRAGRLVVVDTGNHRVQVFSSDPYALLSVWARPTSMGDPSRETVRANFSGPGRPSRAREAKFSSSIEETTESRSSAATARGRASLALMS